VGIVLLVAFCLLMEALFTASEMVLVSADRNKLTERARGGDRGAVLALALLSKPERALATTLTATNVFVVLSSVVVTSRLLPRFGEYAALVAVLLVTPLIIVLGEVVPKSFARPRADRLVSAAGRIVRMGEVSLYPLVAAVSWVARTLSAPFGGIPTMRALVTREELALLLQASRGSGSDVEPHERVMVRRAFHFGEKRVEDVFRPLAQVVALPENATCRDAALLSDRSGYSRYPVYRERVDHLVGYLHVLDVSGNVPDDPVTPLLRKLLFVPELMPLDELLRVFREGRTSFAAVVDEFGGVTGIVTVEDVVEEVVGEIEDEYDRRMEYYTKISEAEFLVPGRMEVGRFAEEIGVRLPEGNYATVGGFLTGLAGRIPAAGETFEVPGAILAVTSASNRAVLEVRVLRVTAGEAGAPGGSEKRER
jgi:CBS domain containing-hemolysin-like protein